MDIVSGSEINVENEIDKKRKEIEQVLSEEKKHIKNQLEDNFKKNLLSKGKDKFKELEDLMKKEEDFLQEKLTDLIDNNEYFGRSIEIDKRVAKKLKKEIMYEINALEKRMLSNEKIIINEIRASVKEDIKLELDNMENSIKVAINRMLNEVLHLVDNERIKEVTTNPKPCEDISKSDINEFLKPVAVVQNPTIEDIAKISVNNSKDNKTFSNESSNDFSIKDLYGKSIKKVPFWGSKSSNIVGSYSLKSQEKYERKDKNKDLYKNFFSSDLIVKKFNNKLK